MIDQRRAFNRRQFLQGMAQFAAVAAAAPALGSDPWRGVTCTTLTAGEPGDVSMSSERLEDVFARIQRRVNDGLFPGATALVARHGVIVGHRAFGNKVAGADDPVTVDTIFDLQSMTKVLSTAASALALVQEGVIRLNDPVARHLPEFAANGKGAVTVHDMLRYSSGLPMDNQFLDMTDDEAVWHLMAETPLEYPTGTSVLYSDLTYRLLGRMIEAAAGEDLDTVADGRIWGPLGMNDTMYNPPPALVERIAATGYSSIRGRVVRGEVQDEQDFALGGVTGCDGVFSTARDIAVFCQMIMNGGAYGRAEVLRPDLVRHMKKNSTPQVTAAATDTSPINNLLFTPKGLGWELWTKRFSHGGMRLSPRAYGKAGGAGTFMWVDPDLEIIGVLLTNHGLPQPFDELGWDRMLDNIGCAEFFDGIINAVHD
ncbi:serine hydrolase domain-containing protein [Sorangium sp. So ce1099]|uniref:serine hydrolase domain-containing protein n=1 Tax=Sorangium sp. So ce1099 TaxID=3133331 RepID=UPI003F5FC517